MLALNSAEQADLAALPADPLETLSEEERWLADLDTNGPRRTMPTYTTSSRSSRARAPSAGTRAPGREPSSSVRSPSCSGIWTPRASTTAERLECLAHLLERRKGDWLRVACGLELCRQCYERVQGASEFHHYLRGFD